MIRTFLAALAVCALFAGAASAHDAKGKRTIVRKINGKWRPFHFQDRQQMKKGHPERRFHLAPLKRMKAIALPIDWAKNLQFPMYGNDRLGDCMWAAAGHAQGTFTGNVGTEVLFDETALEDQYMQLSGGDNGLDEGTLIQGWTAGMNGAPANSAKQRIVDALDIDPTNATMCQTAIQYFGGVLFMLDVPDAWINNFTGNGGDVWDAPARADQNNGHGVWWNGVDANGRYKLQTWGSWVWITPAGVKACDPSAFVVFSPNWFDPKTGLAPNGLHITQLATIWQQAGGAAIPQSVIAAFPPPNGPPAPPPNPTPPNPPSNGITITLTPDQVSAVVNQAGAVALTPEQLKAIQTLQGIDLPKSPQPSLEAPKMSSRADEHPTQPKPVDLPQSRNLPANAGPWPDDLEFPASLQRYERARFTQAIYTLNNRPAIDAVPIGALASKWHQPGGMDGIPGWRSDLYKFIPGGRTWIGGIAVKNSFGFFQTERGHKRAYDDGAMFIDALSYEGKPFEIRQRLKKAGRWESSILFRDKTVRPPGYTGLKIACSACHDEAGTGGYGVGLVPGGDGVLSDPFPELER